MFDLRHGFILPDVTGQTLRETLQGLLRQIDSPYVFVDANGRKRWRCWAGAEKGKGISWVDWVEEQNPTILYLYFVGLKSVTYKA